MKDCPIKVLSICTSDYAGGAARAAYRIHQAVHGLGVNSKMFVKEKGTSDTNVLTVNDFIPHGSLYRYFDWVRNKCKNKLQHYQWGKYPEREDFYMSDLRSTDVGGVIKKVEFDILHLHWINQRFFPLRQLPKNRPIVWTLHDSWPFCGVCHLPFDCKRYHKECGCCPALHSNDPHDLSHIVWAKKKKLYDKLDLHIITPSKWLADCARKSELFGELDIQVIPNCLDTESFCPGDKDRACIRLGLDPNRRHILFGAANALEDKNKGFFFLKEALKMIPYGFSGDTDLVIFGFDDPAYGIVSGMRVLSFGTIKDSSKIIDLYRSSDVTVVPSLSENLSYTIMESLSCGTPVVAFDIGGNGDLIKHETNGYLAKEKNCRDLAEGIVWCLSQDVNSLSRASRNTILDYYTPQIIGQYYLDLYNKLV